MTEFQAVAETQAIQKQYGISYWPFDDLNKQFIPFFDIISGLKRR